MRGFLYRLRFLSDGPLDGKIYASVGIPAPFNRGNVTINSTDTAHDPVINPNLLGDARDVGVAVQGFRRARQIAQTDALQKIIIGEEAFPANGVQSDAEIRQLLTQASNTIYHASYTNAVGRSNDTQAVVDSEADRSPDITGCCCLYLSISAGRPSAERFL